MNLVYTEPFTGATVKLPFVGGVPALTVMVSKSYMSFKLFVA